MKKKNHISKSLKFLLYWQRQLQLMSVRFETNWKSLSFVWKWKRIAVNSFDCWKIQNCSDRVWVMECASFSLIACQIFNSFGMNWWRWNQNKKSQKKRNKIGYQRSVLYHRFEYLHCLSSRRWWFRPKLKMINEPLSMIGIFIYNAEINFIPLGFPF